MAIPERRFLLVGADELGLKAALELNRDKRLPLKLVGYINEKECADSKFCAEIPYIGNFGSLEKTVAEKNVNTLLFAMGPGQGMVQEKLLERAVSAMTVEVQVIPWIARFARLDMSAGSILDVPVISLNENPLAGINVVFKRALDIIVAILAMIILFIPGLAIALAVLISMGRPIFFRQRRLGFNGRVIDVIKFRTMLPSNEAKEGVGWTTKDDPRRTRLGSFLRRFGLDEIPQFWNVLRGEMSVVGPRPEQESHASRFIERLPDYILRLKVKAGITGWAQVNGLRGDTSIEDRLVYDLDYIRKWSLWFDVKIIFMTFFSVFSAKGAY